MSIFDEIKKQQKEKKETTSAAQKGLEWPLDQMYIERALFFVYGGLTTLFIFLAVAFGSIFFLILAMLCGIAQILFAYLGLDIFVKPLASMGLKEKQYL